MLNLAWKETKFLALQSNPDNGITLQAQKNRNRATFMQDVRSFFSRDVRSFFLRMYVVATGVKLW